MELDLIDKKILRCLDRDSRQPYSRIAKSCRISKEIVQYRIKNLHRRGVLLGYYALVDYSKAGRQIFRLYIRLHRCSPGEEEEIIRYLGKFPSAWKPCRIDGEYHLSLGLWMKDIWELEAAWGAFRKKFGEKISKAHLSTMTQYCEYTHEHIYGGNDKVGFELLSRPEHIELDEIDSRLLNILSADARAPLQKLSSDVGAAPATIRLHLKRLIKNKVIVGFRPQISFENLGYQYYKVDMWLSSMEHSERIRNHIISAPGVTYSERTLLSSDIEFDLEVLDFESFISFMDGLKRKFPGQIDDYKYFSRVGPSRTEKEMKN